MKSDGWIALHRKLLDDVLWKNSTPEQKSILITILLLIDHQKNEWEWGGKKFNTKPGQTVTSINSIVKKSGKGITIQNVRSALKRFKKLDFLTEEVTEFGRLITITKWDSYQEKKKKGNKGGQHSTNKGLTPNNNGTMEQSNIYADWFPKELNKKVDDFIENRKLTKSPMTENAINLLIGKIENYSGKNSSLAISMLDDAIINNWKSIYKPKNNNAKGNFDFLKEEK